MTTSPLRIAFMGTPDFTVQSLQALIDHPNVELVCVYTQPPRPAGRGQQMKLSPVHEAAQTRAVPVRTLENFKNPEDVKAFADLDLDVAVVAGFGMLLPKSILSAPKHGCINIHPSLLPRWRGVAPVQYAILTGDAETGVCVMQLDEKMDTGPLIACETVPISPRETTQSLNGKVWPLGAAMLSRAIDNLIRDGRIVSVAQNPEGVTYTKIFRKEDGKIDWTQDAAAIDRQIRALNPWPGTWCESDKGRLKILEASPLLNPPLSGEGKTSGDLLQNDGTILCGGNSFLKLETVQPENKKPMSAAEAFRGGYLSTGQILR